MIKNRVETLFALILLFFSSMVFAGATTLQENARYSAKRESQHFIIELKQPHRVYSTSKNNGGEQSTIKYLVNHQSMEARHHQDRAELILSSDPGSYHRSIAEDLNIDPNQMVLMGTAANMANIAHKQSVFKTLSVDVFATAGVSGNALRAGDPTRWYQTEKGNRSVDYDGTINIVVLINQPISAGAQAKAVMIVTEAKSAALSMLAVPSRKSQHLATGTGTDQLVIATPVSSDTFERQSASGHLKIGELIGTTVREAVLEALKWQNRLTAESIVSVEHALGRYGFSKERMLDQISHVLSKKSADLAHHNVVSINGDPRLVAAAYGYAQLLDRMGYGTFSKLVAHEVLKDYAAIAAVSVSAKPENYHQYWTKLEYQNDPIKLFNNAIALGWQAKWE